MNERGEKQFSHLPKFAAKLYDKLMKNKPIELQISEIANDIISNCNSGSILDVGTGHGRLLKKLHELAPNLELYGLDISHAMIKLAKNNLKSYNIDLQVSNILKTPYNDENFDIVTCTGSFYLWNKPIESVNEIFRILKPEGMTLLYETYKDYEPDKFEEALKSNIEGMSFFKKKLVSRFLKKQLKMTYTLKEIEEILIKSRFASKFNLLKMKISNLPIWVRIELIK